MLEDYLEDYLRGFRGLRGLPCPLFNVVVVVVVLIYKYTDIQQQTATEKVKS